MANRFPITEPETVPVWLLFVLVILLPAAIILLVCLVFVPGSTVPKGTPRSLVWRRKLWELHVGWLGLALAIVAAWFVTSGLKNMLGKPRPDLLSRCEPDLDNIERYIVGGIGGGPTPSTLSLNQIAGIGTLVSADICQASDDSKVDEGFRSFPSGHSSSSASGLIYLSLFLASKFAVTIPFVASQGNAAASSAFPSRLPVGPSRRPTSDSQHYYSLAAGQSDYLMTHNKMITAVRRQAAAPPIYLLSLVLVPFFLSIFIAGSRWFDYRHHAFDILSGYFIGLVSAIFAFYYYHLPIRHGAGWAWGPRSNDKAWWAGVGSYSYATDKKDLNVSGDAEEMVGLGANGQASSTQAAHSKEREDIARGNEHGLKHSNLNRRDHSHSTQRGPGYISNIDQPETYRSQSNSSSQAQQPRLGRQDDWPMSSE